MGGNINWPGQLAPPPPPPGGEDNQGGRGQDICPEGKIIRIYQECEGRIEKSVSRIAVWHHEACQVMRNGDVPRDIFFLSYPKSFQKSLNTLRYNFTR